MNERIIDFIRSSSECQRNKVARHQLYGPSSPLELSYAPWQSLAIDFITELPVSEGGNQLWVIIDRFTKMVVKNLVQQASWHWCWCHSHPCRPVVRPRFRCRSRGHPPRLGASTDLRHIAPVAISPTAGRSRPLSFVSIMLLARPSPVIVTYVVSC